jgi:hypothetical protein
MTTLQHTSSFSKIDCCIIDSLSRKRNLQKLTSQRAVPYLLHLQLSIEDKHHNFQKYALFLSGLE